MDNNKQNIFMNKDLAILAQKFGTFLTIGTPILTEIADFFKMINPIIQGVSLILGMALGIMTFLWGRNKLKNQ
jgi:hypothetical protein